MEKPVAVIVVTYNRKELLRECLQSLREQTTDSFDVLIVDNCSTDGTKDFITDYLWDNRFLYFNTGENIGGAGGFNYGLKKAYSLGYEYFFLMDDDAILALDCIEVMLKTARDLDNKFGFLCANVRWTDGSACAMNRPQINPDWTGETELVQQGLIRVKTATFVGFLTHRTVVEKIGLPIKEFFIWNDDTNFSLRINREFSSSYCVLNSIIVHKIGTNSSASIVSDDSGRLERYFYAYRNRLCTAKMMGLRKRYATDFMKTTLLILMRSDHKSKRLYYMYRGLVAGLFFSPKVEKL